MAHILLSFALENLKLGLVVIILSGSLYILASTIYQYRRLRQFPGPPSAGFSKWWWLKNAWSGHLNLAHYEAIKKYGSIIRVAPNVIITSDPNLMKHILNVRSGYQRSPWYQVMQIDPGVNNVLSTIDDDAHNKLRAKLGMGYSGKDVEGVEPRIDRNVMALIKLLDEKYVSLGKAFDFARKAQYFTMDTISDICYDEAFGFLSTDSDLYNYIEDAEKGFRILMLLTLWPWVVALMSVLKSYIPTDDTLGFAKVKMIAKQKALERFGPNKKEKNDMLGSFVAHGLTVEEAEPEVILQIMAGSDTTATAIRATILHVITNPRIVAALHAELEAHGIMSRDWDSIIRDAEARKLPYLQAIIKEGLRIWPPIAAVFPKIVPRGGDTYKGIHFPAGTEVGYCSWGVMRRREVWGDDAAEFRPERWLEATPEKLKEMESTLDLTFHYGRWQCLGKNIAMMELNKVFVELLRRFDFVVVNPSRPWKTQNCGVHSQSEFWIRGYRRG